MKKTNLKSRKKSLRNAVINVYGIIAAIILAFDVYMMWHLTTDNVLFNLTTPQFIVRLVIGLALGLVGACMVGEVFSINETHEA